LELDGVMLLVESTLRCSVEESSNGIATLTEKKQESLVSLELDVHPRMVSRVRT
jgi:hypothetical protein